MIPPSTALLAAGSLIAGFAVAQSTGVRPLGGAVLLIGGAVCALHWWRVVGPARAAALVALFLGAFALSHPLAKVTGAWPSVLAVSAGTAAVVWLVVDRRQRLRLAGEEGTRQEATSGR
jgi:hypothetical protein